MLHSRLEEEEREKRIYEVRGREGEGEVKRVERGTKNGTASTVAVIDGW